MNQTSQIINIFFFDGWLGVAPSVVNLAQCFAEMGFVVNIFCRQDNYPDVDLSSHPNIRKVYLSDIDYNVSGGLAKFAREAARMFVELSAAQDCLLNVGIDWGGSLVAILIRETLNIPYVYLSLEIATPTSRFATEPLLKMIDQLSLQTADLLLIQDEDRLQALLSLYGCRTVPHVLLPNSPRGRHSVEVDKGFLARRVGLDRSKVKITVLYAGLMADTMYTEVMVRAFSSVNKDVVLICHDRVQRSTSEPYIKSLIESAPDNVFFSMTPVDMNDLPHVYAAADIGVVLYMDINENYSLIAKASGKLGYYLKYGKPLIVNNIPSLRKFIDEFACGVIIDDVASPQAWAAAVDSILSNYDTYSENCRKAFRDVFDFDVSFVRVEDVLRSKGLLSPSKSSAISADRLMQLVNRIFPEDQPCQPTIWVPSRTVCMYGTKAHFEDVR
jgi:glycosyltransferase involved in cell wall biosynthesis